MPTTFSFAMHPADARILRIHGSGGQRLTPEWQAAIQADLGELYQFVTAKFEDRPFRLMSVLDNMALALGNEEEMATQGSLALAQVFNVERAAYVIDKATMRLQFGRLFRENKLSDRFKAFSKEDEGLSFLVRK